MKKIIRNVFLSLICFLAAESLIPVNTSAAETAEVSGIGISISSDKEEYSSDDEVRISYSIENKNAHDISDASVKLNVPEGLSLKSGSSSEQTVNVSAGGTINGNVVLLKSSDTSVSSSTTSKNTSTATTTAAKKSNGSTKNAKTGDFTNIYIPLAIIAAAAAIAFITRKKNKNPLKFFSVLLCLAVIASSTPLEAFSAEKQHITASVDKTIKLGNKSYKLELSFSADMEQGITVTIDRSDTMFENEGYNGLFVSSKLDELSGTVSSAESAVKSVSVSVTAGKKTLDQNKPSLENGKWVLKEPQLIIGDNEIRVNAVNEKGETASAVMHIWNTSYDNSNLLILDTNDDDKDGLMNYQEEQYGTDPAKKDTDGDSFSDIDEIFLLKTDPVVFNEDEDFDNDGLSNLNELKNNTDPWREDTDHDGLNDGDEVNKYKTDPKMSDTDRDSITDDLEIRYDTDPLTAEKTDENGKISVEYSPDQSGKAVNASIDISLSPEQLASFRMDDIKPDDAVLSSDIPGYIGDGSAYDFSLDGQFSDAKLSFVIPEDLMNDPDFEPGIYYYNEETGLLEELENTTVDGNTVSVQLEHFSKYILLNKKEYGSVWTYDLLFVEAAQGNTGLDVVFAIDSSGSMLSNDYNGIRKTVTKDFIEKLTGNDKAAVVDFDSTAKLLSGFSDDKAVLNSAADQIDSYGGTNLSTGISTGLNLFDASDYSGDGKQKCIIMLTDGQGSYDVRYTTKAKDMGVTIYTIGLGSSVSKSVLTTMAESTGGEYFPASEANKLYGIFDTIFDLTELNKDTDDDGISDYHEKAMASGQLRLGTGVSLTAMDYQNPDSDGDTVKDGVELQIVQSGATQYGTKVYAVMHSNPTEPDSDFDGVGDEVELYDVPTSIGTHPLNPLDNDTDDDGLSDSEELGSMTSYGYYRVNSNPFAKEDFNLGNQGAYSFCYAAKIQYPLLKFTYTSGTLDDGRPYTVYTFLDSTLPSALTFFTSYGPSGRKLIEVGSGLSTEYYVLYAMTGDNVRGGQYDEIYRKAILLPDVMLGMALVTDAYLPLVGLNSKWHETWQAYDSDPGQFMYYSNSKSKVLSIDEWKVMNFETRFELNCDYDKYLPINSHEADLMGFDKLPEGQAIYHMPAGIDNECQAGSSHKFIRTDGLEAIYKVLRDVNSADEVTQDPTASELLPLQENPVIGPTFNYSPNDSLVISDASIAHYYFDMVPYFWWGTVR